MVYDVNVNTIKAIESVLDRASYLSKSTGSDPFEQSIVLVLHEPEINFFALKSYDKHTNIQT